MRTKKAYKNTLYGILSLFVLSLFSLILSRVILLNLGVEYNGLNGVFTNILSILSISELGVAGAISYSLYKPILDNNVNEVSKLMTFFKKFYIKIGLFIFLASVVISLFVPLLIKNSTFDYSYISFVFIIFSINTSISYFFSYNRTLFYAKQDNYYVLKIDFYIKVIKTLVQIFMLYLTKNYIVFIFTNIIFTFINNYSIHLLAKKMYPEVILYGEKIDKETKANIFKIVRDLAVIQVLSVAINFIDNIVVSSIISISAAGLFVNYNLIYLQIQSIINVCFYSGLGASLGNLIAEGVKEKIDKVTYKIEYLTFFLASFLTIGTYFLLQIFLGGIWLGDEYLLSNTFAVLVAINVYVYTIKQPLNYYLRLSGNNKDLLLPLSIESLLNLVLSLLLAVSYGVTGVVTATLISGVSSYLLMSINYNKKLLKSNYLFLRRQFLFLIFFILQIVLSYIVLSILVIENVVIEFFVVGSIVALINIMCSIIVIVINPAIQLPNVFKFIKK